MARHKEIQHKPMRGSRQLFSWLWLQWCKFSFCSSSSRWRIGRLWGRIMMTEGFTEQSLSFLRGFEDRLPGLRRDSQLLTKHANDSLSKVMVIFLQQGQLPNLNMSYNLCNPTVMLVRIPIRR